jgi:hypothetical protein
MKERKGEAGGVVQLGEKLLDKIGVLERRGT